MTGINREGASKDSVRWLVGWLIRFNVELSPKMYWQGGPRTRRCGCGGGVGEPHYTVNTFCIKMGSR